MISAVPAKEWEQTCREICGDLLENYTAVKQEFHRANTADREDCRGLMCAILFTRLAFEEALRSSLSLDTDEDVLETLVGYTTQNTAKLLVHLLWRQTFTLAENSLPLSQRMCRTILRVSRQRIHQFFNLDEDEDEDEDDDDEDDDDDYEDDFNDED